MRERTDGCGEQGGGEEASAREREAGRRFGGGGVLGVAFEDLGLGVGADEEGGVREGRGIADTVKTETEWGNQSN